MCIYIYDIYIIYIHIYKSPFQLQSRLLTWRNFLGILLVKIIYLVELWVGRSENCLINPTSLLINLYCCLQNPSQGSSFIWKNAYQCHLHACLLQGYTSWTVRKAFYQLPIYWDNDITNPKSNFRILMPELNLKKPFKKQTKRKYWEQSFI